MSDLVGNSKDRFYHTKVHFCRSMWEMMVTKDFPCQTPQGTVNYVSTEKIFKFLDRKVWANSADQDQAAPKGLHCLSFHLHLLDPLPYEMTSLFEF